MFFWRASMAAESKHARTPESVVTGHGGNPPGQGPFLNLTLHVAAGIILQASFETYQCPGCVACGQVLVTMLSRKRLADARTIRHEDVVSQVGPLPKHRQICYGLVILALDDALNQVEKDRSVEREDVDPSS
jgi:NifU-like protein involved in Fe-S cluster formation